MSPNGAQDARTGAHTQAEHAIGLMRQFAGGVEWFWGAQEYANMWVVGEELSRARRGKVIPFVEIQGEQLIVPEYSELWTHVQDHWVNNRLTFLAHSNALPPTLANEFAVITQELIDLGYEILITGSAYDPTTMHVYEDRLVDLLRDLRESLKRLLAVIRVASSTLLDAPISLEDFDRDIAVVPGGPYKDSERLVLRVLLESGGMWIKQVDLIERVASYGKSNSDENRYGEHSVRRALSRLERMGAVERKGQRGGYAITGYGQKIYRHLSDQRAD